MDLISLEINPPEVTFMRFAILPDNFTDVAVVKPACSLRFEHVQKAAEIRVVENFALSKALAG